MTIEVDLDELYLAFEAVSNYDGEANYYFDKQTGKIIVEVSGYPFYLVDYFPLPYSEYCIEKDITNDFLLDDFSEKNERYIAIPIYEPIKTNSEINTDNYYDMQLFVDDLSNSNLKIELQQIIDRGYASHYAIKQFLELMKQKNERKQWLLFREKQQEKRATYISQIVNYRMISWLKSQNMLDSEDYTLV